MNRNAGLMSAAQRTAVATAVIILAGHAPASAAQQRDTIRADSTRALPLPPLLVTASHAPVRSDRIGFAFSVVPASELQLRNPATAADALRYVGGTFIDEANGPGGPTIVRLRGGEEVFTQILMDGVQINENGGFFDFLGFTPGNLERIEIMRGPQSALYGSSAMSGVVQFLTRAGSIGPMRASVSAEGSVAAINGGGYRGQAEISGGTRAVRYSAGAGWTFSRGIYDLPNDAKTRDASARLDVQPSDRFTLTGTFRYVGVDAMLPVRDPGATRVPLDPNAQNERDRIVSSITARYAPSASVDHQLRATLYAENFVYDDKRDNVANTGNYPFFIFDADFRLESDRMRAAIEYAGDYRAGGGEAAPLVLSWGVRAENESVGDTTSGEFGNERQKFDRSSTAAFGEVLVRPVPWLDLLAGVRAEKYEGIDVAVTPRGSAVIHASPNVALRLAAGRAFKAPNLQQQYLSNPFIVSNPDLEPETSTSYEAGIDLRSGDGRWSGGVTVFTQEYENLIRSVATDETGSQQQNRNLGSSNARGVEWQLAFQPSARWLVGVDGAWLRTRIVDATGLPAESFPEGEELPFRPSTVATAFVQLSPVDALTLRVRGSYVGPQTVLTERFSGPRARIDGYTLFGLDAAWTLNPHWSLHTRVDNLFDTEYQTAFDRRGIPATAAIGFRWHN